MNLKDLSLNKMKSGKTFNVAGIDTGIPNPLGAAADTAKSKFYNTMAGLEGGGSTTGGGGGYTFVGGDGTGSGLENLLGGAKKVAPYVAAGLGFALGSSGNSGETTQALPTQTTQTSPAQNVYQTETIGGYTYDQLEQGYANALAAGDTVAANQIASLIDLLDKRVERVQEATKSNTSSTALDAVNQLEQLYNNIGASGTGVIQGKVTSAGNWLTGGGYNTAAQTYDSMKKGMLGLILKKGLSESGALSDADIQRAMNLLPNLDTNEKAAKAQFSQLRQLLQTVAQNG